VGYVALDEDRISHVHLRVEGWVERLAVKSEGERMEAGERLFQVYSPQLVNAQEEFLQARATGNASLQKASRARLEALGLTPGQIDAVARSGQPRQLVSVYAPDDGIVAQLNIREGMYVEPATEVMTLAELSSVWLLAEVFERQAAWVEPGQPAEVRTPFLPGEVWEGEVEYVYPELDPKTRTLRVRLRFDNPQERLKPNMFADVTIYGGARRGVLSVPREALIRTGSEDRVILALGDGRFQPREVVPGIETGDWVEIREGLAEGERVVVSGQFLIDSESSMKASLMRMTRAGE
jgi:Cu(I)/Ag(I) efflux system membrane fusion protein